MSFGFSPSDIVALVNITSKAYQGWKHACGEYSEVTGTLDSLLIVLQRIETEASKPNSVLLRTTNDRNDLKDILFNCEPTVRELNSIVARFGSLGASREKNWDKLRFGVKNLDPLRTKLSQHIAAITAYLDAVGLGALTRIERDLNAIPERTQKTIDALAAEIRAGRREGSIMTTYSEDEKDVWRQFRRELIGDGMKSGFVHKYKPLIRKYLKELAEKGELEELPPDEDIVMESDSSSSTAAEAMMVDESLARQRSLSLEKAVPIASKEAPQENVSQEAKEDLPPISIWVKSHEDGSLDAQCLNDGWSPTTVLRSCPPDQLSWRNLESGDEVQLHNSIGEGVELFYYSSKGDGATINVEEETSKPSNVILSTQEGVEVRKVTSSRLNWEATSVSESPATEIATDEIVDVQHAVNVKAEMGNSSSTVPPQNISSTSQNRTERIPRQQTNLLVPSGGKWRHPSSFSRGHPPISPRRIISREALDPSSPLYGELPNTKSANDVSGQYRVSFEDFEASDHDRAPRRRRRRVYYPESNEKTKGSTSSILGAGLAGIAAGIALNRYRKVRDQSRYSSDDNSD